MIVGMGECAWNENTSQQFNHPFLEKFAFEASQGRAFNWAYYSGWDWINYWPNFLQGMNASRHAWKQQYHEDRVDGVDGWNSPVIRWVQRLFSPYLVLDQQFYAANGAFSSDWPAKLPSYAPGDKISRTVLVFNDSLAGDQLTLRWSFHWDSPDGPNLAKGEKGLVVKPGFHVDVNLQAVLPNSEQKTDRKLFLSLESSKDGHNVFHDESTCFLVRLPPVRNEPVNPHD